MNLYNSKTYINDLVQVIKSNFWLSFFENTTIFITGATGLICSGVADLLLYYSELTGGSISVYIAGRNKEKVWKRFSRFVNYSFFHYVNYNANKNNCLDFYADYIVHGASSSYPAAIQSHPIETMKENFLAMSELLEYGDRCAVKNIVYISSSEVYGNRGGMEPFRENEYGYIDILNPRSAYSEGKRATETLCVSYVYERKVPVSIVRPGHIYGPTASKDDNRVASVFAYDVMNGKDLVLKSSGNQIRSYCYLLDCATAILKVVLNGKPATAYNISNPLSVMSIMELANIFARFGNVQIRYELPDKVEKAAFNPMQNSSLNSERLSELGWKGIFDAQKGIEHTVKIMKEAREFG